MTLPRLSDDGDHLQDEDQVDDAIAGAELGVRLAEPVGQHAVFGHAHQHAGRADDGGVDGAGENQEADQHHEDAEGDARQHRAHHVHGQAGNQVVLIDLRARPGGDQHGGQQRGAAGKDQAVDGDDDRGALQVLELGVLDLAIDLRQALLAAHGQDGVAEGHENAEQAEDRQAAALQESQRVVAEVEVRGNRRRRKVHAHHADRVHAPDQQNDHHHRGDLHNAQRLVARFLDALDVLPPVVDGHQRRQTAPRCSPC